MTTDRSDTGVLVYGSLLHPAELEQSFPAAHGDAVPVRVEGYRRSFAQKSTFREGRGGERGVLALRPAPDAWANAVCVPRIRETKRAEYLDRESGYNVRSVDPDAVTPYDPSDSSVIERCTDLLVAVGDRPLDDPEPIPSYAALATTGATLHGDQFLTDFLVSTNRE